MRSITSLACLIPMALLASSAQATGTAQDFDLACAVTSAAEVVSTPSGSEAREFAFRIHWFYVGRLSGRDDNTYWFAVVQGKLAQLKDKARNSDLYGECLVFAAKQIS